jgi:hypothetical protein
MVYERKPEKINVIMNHCESLKSCNSFIIRKRDSNHLVYAVVSHYFNSQVIILEPKRYSTDAWAVGLCAHDIAIMQHIAGKGLIFTLVSSQPPCLLQSMLQIHSEHRENNLHSRLTTDF